MLAARHFAARAQRPRKKAARGRRAAYSRAGWPCAALAAAWAGGRRLAAHSHHFDMASPSPARRVFSHGKIGARCDKMLGHAARRRSGAVSARHGFAGSPHGSHAQLAVAGGDAAISFAPLVTGISASGGPPMRRCPPPPSRTWPSCEAARSLRVGRRFQGGGSYMLRRSRAAAASARSSGLGRACRLAAYISADFADISPP